MAKQKMTQCPNKPKYWFRGLGGTVLYICENHFHGFQKTILKKGGLPIAFFQLSYEPERLPHPQNCCIKTKR